MTSEVEGGRQTGRGNSEVESCHFEDSKPCKAAVIFERAIIAALGGYLVSILAFIIFFPAGWMTVVFAFLSGSLVNLGVVFLLRRIIGDHT